MAYGSAINAKTLADGDSVRAADINSTSDVLARWSPGQPPVGTITQYLKTQDPGNLVFLFGNTVYIMDGQANTAQRTWTLTDADGNTLTADATSAIVYIPDTQEIIVSQDETARVYTPDGVYKREFTFSYTNVQAMAYDPANKNLIIAEQNSSPDKIRIMDGVSGTDSSSFDSPAEFPFSLVVNDDGNLIVGAGTGGTKSIYIQSGITATNSSSFLVPDDGHTGSSDGAPIPRGLAFDHVNGNLISVTTINQDNVFNVHSGETSTVSNSYEFVGDDGTNVILGATFIRFDAIPDGWVEATGQTLSDPDSLWDGKTLPNLSAATVVDADAVWIMRVK